MGGGLHRNLLIIWVLLVQTKSENEICPTVKSTNFSIEWPETATSTLSQPPCTDTTQEFVSRGCQNGLWDPEPQCTCIRPKTLPECPDGFTDVYSFCYIIIHNTTFPLKCPFPHVLPFNSYIGEVELDGPVWMPIRRDSTSGVGFLQWMEASDLYRTEFKDYIIFGGVKGKDCVVYHNDTYKVLVSCDDEYSGVCAYEKLDHTDDQMCPTHPHTCRQSDFDPASKCICLGGTDLNQEEFVKAEFLKLYQNRVYRLLTSDYCTIGLQHTAEGYVWTDSKQKLDYCYWNTETVFDDEFIYGASTIDGLILTKEPLPCFLFQTDFEIPEPELVLAINPDNYFTLNITNPKGLKRISTLPEVLVYCFTDSGPLSLIYRYEVITKLEDNIGNTALFEFEPYKYGPGHYWCEGFKYFNSEIVKSNVIFVNDTQRFGAEFVAILKTSYVVGTDPLDVFNFLALVFFIKLRNTEEDFTYTSRIMNIVDIDEDNHYVTVSIHFTYVQNENSLPMPSNTDEEFDRMRQAINKTLSDLSGVDIQMEDFLSATYCFEETANGVQFPKTEIGQEVPIYCFDSNGIRLARSCTGDFISGAKWSQVDECTIPDQSSVTEELFELMGDDNPAEGVYNISLRFDEFYSIDIYLITWIIYNKSDKMKAVFIQILDNLFNVDADVLQNAQNQMRTSDIILDTMDELLVETDNSSVNFHIMAATPLEISGLVSQNGVQFELPGDYTLQNIVDTYPDLEVAIWLNPDLRSSLVDQNVVFKVFYNTVLFASSDARQQVLGKIFGVVVPKVELLKNSIYFLYKASGDFDEDCAYWNHNLSASDGRGAWKTGDKSTYSPGFLLCEFDTEFASALTVLSSSLITNTSQTVTEDLETLLESDKPPSEIIDELVLLSDRFDEFTSNDVFLVSEILEKISYYPEVDLSALARIVSNLHEIDRMILSDSQKKKLATDAILHSVDTIIKNHNFTNPINVTADNFMIFIDDLADSDFSGIILYDDSKKLLTEKLVGDVDIDDVLDHDNFNSALLLPSSLKQQMADDTIITVTIFSSDGLFNEEVTIPKFVSKVFGVILPKITEYPEPLSFVYQVSAKNFERNCAYWSYNKTENITGLWKKDNKGKNVSIFSKCEFWHTTHFALLLLDQDKYDYAVLEWITNINCGLSVFGLGCIFLTAILFKRWRTNSGNQILLNFVFAIILQIAVFYASSNINQGSDDYLLCTIIGVVLHYTIVSQFCWMFVIAILQFKRFVEVLKGPPKHVLLKGCLCGWLLPCLPVACVYFLDNDNYVNGQVGLCYPSGLGLYLGVWLPIAIIVVINCVIFVYIIYNVVHRKTECSDVGTGDLMIQWRLAILLFFMLGITWTFGFLSELDFGIVFVYAFCITATLQGFVMFLFFIVFNSNTRYLYAHALKGCCNKDY